LVLPRRQRKSAALELRQFILKVVHGLIEARRARALRRRAQGRQRLLETAERSDRAHEQDE